ncbi:MAG: hypothetical protein RDU24_11985 [Humidesulfovibrio sp.]|uniref:hypothetical protein n=1 Tax=Humidesulfovibrio sp. TaxID=2910988 RepID=UPI0027EC73CF|nr:hypothetical protein [Humidesulfovibrio sp.]MDQ7836094.1 hypothetical protein [Humidesulfovibrio sp.]
MSDDKTKREVDARFVSCAEDEGYEETYTATKIAFENGVSMEEARKAFKHCCKAVTGNQPRKAFMECAKKYLGK